MEFPIEVEELVDVLMTLWETTVGSTLEHVGAGEASSFAGFLASVEIRGGWEGQVVLECSEGPARRLAGSMFDVEPAAATPQDVEDALAELANIVGGNVLPLLPEDARLTFPVVRALSPAGVRGGREALEFVTEEGPLRVTVESSSKGQGRHA